MKALSIRQPWAWLITHGLKDVENRTWPTRFRGNVLIHAAKRMTQAEFDNAIAFASSIGADVSKVMTNTYKLERGGIVGVATIADCLRDSTSPWQMPNCWGFRIANAKPLPLIPCKGALGFFEVPNDVAMQLRTMHLAATQSEGATR